MDNLIFAFNTILPLLIIIGAGFFVKRLNMIPDTVVKCCNNLVFRVFLPILLMRNLMNTTSEDILSPGIFIFIGISVTLLFVILFIIVPIFSRNRKSTGTIIQGIGRSNYAIFGIPLVTMLFPDHDISLISLLTILIVPLLNTYSAIALVVYTDKRVSLAKSIKSIILNPLVIGSTIGFVLMLIKPPIPAFIDTSLKNLSQVASPLALFMLGASLEFKKIVQNKRTLIITTIAKLIISPVIFITAAILFGFRDIELAAVLISFGAPTSVNSYTMAEQMGGDGDLAGEIVIFTSFFSIFTVFLIIYILKAIGCF